MAAKLTEYALKSLVDDCFNDGEEILLALQSKYADLGEYKIVKLKKYMKANGYTHPIIDKANIDKKL